MALLVVPLVVLVDKRRSPRSAVVLALGLGFRRLDNEEIVDQCNNLAYGGTRASRPKTLHGRLDFGARASRPFFFASGRDARAPIASPRTGTAANLYAVKRLLGFEAAGKRQLVDGYSNPMLQATIIK